MDDKFTNHLLFKDFKKEEECPRRRIG